MTLKLKTADFRIRTRAHSFELPTQFAGKLFAAARTLLEREADGTKFRLLGVGLSASPPPIKPIRRILPTAAPLRPSTRSTACAPVSATMP